MKKMDLFSLTGRAVRTLSGIKKSQKFPYPDKCLSSDKLNWKQLTRQMNAILSYKLDYPVNRKLVKQYIDAKLENAPKGMQLDDRLLSLAGDLFYFSDRWSHERLAFVRYQWNLILKIKSNAKRGGK